MISAAVLTKNEERNIVECLESLKWCDEIIVIDDYSEDNTIKIAQKIGAKVFKHSLNDDFSKLRNFGLEKAKGDWILFVDADERISEDLKDEISYLISFGGRRKQLNGYFIKRTDFMWGKELKYGETGNIKLLRLAKKGKGMWEGMVHETWKVKGKIGQLKNPLMHYPHRSIDEFLKEINFYTSIKVKELYGQNVHASWFSIIAYPLGKFLLNYFIKKGLLDGIPGLIVAIMMSLHSFILRGKLWIWQRKKEK